MTMERGLFMPYIPADVVSRAKQMDLYTYLHDYEPQELVHLGGGTYCTREHDSLKISNGKWYWFSQSIGGRSALDYLIKVRGTPFNEQACRPRKYGWHESVRVLLTTRSRSIEVRP